MRALLDLMRDNQTAVQHMAAVCINMLEHDSARLKILDPETGDKKLIEGWARQVSHLRKFNEGTSL